ncbi:probable calcium-binding protein CML46 [Henckelia pumila]|uniref:probable calcium-binding protein CML46 n=1 Tax=Henckelia pumila TaxID=405737 RepID=UPI003C6E352C
MENISLNPIPRLIEIALNKKRFYDTLLSRFNSTIQSHFATTNSRIQPEKKLKINDFDPKYKRVVQTLSCKDTETVLTRLGLNQTSEGGSFPSTLDENDIFSLFESRSPCLGEVKEAFDVFDKNNDGFIEAWELRKVLCDLGLEREGSRSMEDCARMIGVFDENGDGRIDFDEFVKFMENASL